jgi:adenylate cyclase
MRLALRAPALALQAAAAALVAENPGWPELRIGVNTGNAYAGLLGADSGHRTHGVIGDAVNLAARLEAQAAPGEVVIGAETARRLPSGRVVVPLPALVVKGKEMAVEAYRLVDLPP